MQETKPISHIIAGLTIAAAVIILSLIMGGQGVGQGMLPVLLVIVGLSVFIRLFGKANGYQKTFGELFSYGFKATAVLTLMLVVYMLCYSFTVPELKAETIHQTRIQMEKDKMSDEQIDQYAGLLEKYFWAFAIGGTVLAYIIIGVIGSLIGAGVTPKRPKTPFDQLSI
jgi:hypothetical protein